VDFHFSTVVWGPWHTGVYLDANLPSLLAPENLPAFAKKHRVTYRILTSKRDIPRIEASPAFQRARSIVPFELVACPVEDSSDPIAMHHQLWRRSIAEARNANAMILFVPPDVIWANGALGHVADLFEQGKRAVFMTYMRVVSETCIPEARRRYLAADGATIEASSRDLVRLCFEHIHPLALTYLHDSPHFPIHPELILWPVSGEGYLMRVLVREMFAYDPKLISLNQQALPANVPDPDLMHYINDSDDLFSLSLTPLTKDVNWYSGLQSLNPIKIGSWWLAYDSPANDIVAKTYFYVHSGPKTPEKWRSVEIESDVMMRRIAGARELLRVIGGMVGEDTLYARQVLSMALAETKLAEYLRCGGPFTVLIPNDQAMIRYLNELGDDFIEVSKSEEFLRLIMDHVVIGRIPPDAGRVQTLRTLNGGKREVTWQYGDPVVDGAILRAPGFPLISEENDVSEGWAFLIDRVLPTADR